MEKYEEIAKDIKARKFSPVYVFMGEEPYFIDQLTDMLLTTVLNESERDFNQLIMYGADTNVTKIIEAARRFPLMSEYQLVVVREAQLIRDIDTLIHYVKNPLKSTILVINYKYTTLDKRKSLASTIDKTGVLFESKKIKNHKIPSFIIDLLKERNIFINAKSAQMLADYLGNDLGKLNKELDKLTLLLPKEGKKTITPELIEQNIGISKEYNNYELIKAIASKDVLKANRIIQYFEKNPKNNPIQSTLPVLFNYFSNLLICQYSKDRSEKGIMSALGLYQTYQTTDYKTGLTNFSPMKVFNLISEIRTTDAKSKGVDNASVDNGNLLKELLFKMLH
ncbi:MAG: DNA polymerase III subunit delta [Tannerellaceae bacterium]|jgi:DNA polymerase-3 subunit delta|nr:DNA polymerase III subunit delta [Tannerellaceae bacterium]